MFIPIEGLWYTIFWVIPVAALYTLNIVLFIVWFSQFKYFTLCVVFLIIFLDSVLIHVYSSIYITFSCLGVKWRYIHQQATQWNKCIQLNQPIICIDMSLSCSCSRVQHYCTRWMHLLFLKYFQQSYETESSLFWKKKS